MISRTLLFVLKWALIVAIPYVLFGYFQFIGQNLGRAIALGLGFPDNADPLQIGHFIFYGCEALIPGAAILGGAALLYTLGSWGTRTHLRLVLLVVCALAFLRPWQDILGKFREPADIFTLGGMTWYAEHGDATAWFAATFAALILSALTAALLRAPRRHRLIGGREIIPDGPWRDRWASMGELWWRYRSGWGTGLVIGERYRRDLEPDYRDSAWGSALAALPIPLRGGGLASLIRVNPKGHLLTIAGSGGGKSSGYAIPNLLLCRDISFIAMDLSGELWRDTARVRELAGRRVLYIDPSDENTWGCNVVASLGLNPATRDSDAKKICGWIKANQKVPGGSGGEMFSTLGWALVQGVILAEMERAPGQWSLGDVARIVQLPTDQLDAELSRIYAACPAARQLLGQVMGIKAPETRAGVFANAASYLEVFASPSGNRMLSGRTGRSFDIADLLDGGTDLYIRMPRDLIPMYSGGLQLLLGAINSAIEARGKLPALLVYMLDEFPQIAGRGPSCVIMSGIETMRKYNVIYWLFAQSRAQYFDIYGQERGKVLEDSCYLRMYLGVEEQGTAQMLSEACGFVTVRQETVNLGESGQSAIHGVGSRSENSGRSEQGIKEPLIKVAEIRKMCVTDDIPDEQIILQRGRRPARVGVARWYRRRSLTWLHSLGAGQTAAGPAVVAVE